MNILEIYIDHNDIMENICNYLSFKDILNLYSVYNKSMPSNIVNKIQLNFCKYEQIIHNNFEKKCYHCDNIFDILNKLDELDENSMIILECSCSTLFKQITCRDCMTKCAKCKKILCPYCSFKIHGEIFCKRCSNKIISRCKCCSFNFNIFGRNTIITYCETCDINGCSNCIRSKSNHRDHIFHRVNK